MWMRSRRRSPGAKRSCGGTIPSRGMVSPADFIPIAEESGLIVPIGAWVIEEACRQAAGWPDGQRISLNISPVQFRDRDLPDCDPDGLAERPASRPNRLEVEVTETVLVVDAEAALDLLTRIRALGVRIALDDFGTGYSSLSYLWRFPFDKIKIDRSFVWEIDSRRRQPDHRSSDPRHRPRAQHDHHGRGGRNRATGRAPEADGLSGAPRIPVQPAASRRRP